MKRVLSFILVLLIIVGMPPSRCDAYNGSVIVYVTKTGDCYHTGNCSYLKSSREITLAEAAAAGYRRCSRCHPPIYVGMPVKTVQTAEPSYTSKNQTKTKVSGLSENDPRGALLGLGLCVIVFVIAVKRK